MRLLVCLSLGLTALLLTRTTARPAEPTSITVTEDGDAVYVETDALSAKIRKKGYVSGVAQGSFVDKKTGAKDVGFGLHIMDFLMAPGWRDDHYSRDKKVHGDLPKHYIEGPQICTQAKELTPEVIKGKDFVAVRLRYRFTEPAEGFKAGSTWEQTLVFKPGLRYMLSAERITSINDVDDLFYRIDMPGHVRHTHGDTIAQVYLSYQGKIPVSEFFTNFGPDEKFVYQRQSGKVPDRMIRGYQVKVDGKPGPWLLGLTLDPAECCEAWCHQRGYICFIEELHRKKVRAGESFGAAYAVGYFDDIAEAEKVYDRYRGTGGIAIENGQVKLEPTAGAATPAKAPAPPAQTASSFPPLPPLPTDGPPLPGTQPLRRDGDLARQMVEGIDRYLMRELAASPERRQQFWKPDYSSPETSEKSVEPNRQRLRKILGVVDQRLPNPQIQVVTTVGQPALVGVTASFKVFAVRLPVLEGVDAEGLLLEPNAPAKACVVALPDADQTPEAVAGFATAPPGSIPFARRLAENGCRVLVLTLIDRKDTWSGNPKLGRMTNQPHREFIYRMAYELGRHVIGYEVQKVLAAVDWFCHEEKHPPVGVFGYGEGGLVALSSAALDPRIAAVVASGSFGSPEGGLEPIYRNVWGSLSEFGNAGLAALVAPRTVIIENATAPASGSPLLREGRAGAAPGGLHAPTSAQVLHEFRLITEKGERLKITPDQLRVTYFSCAFPGERATLETFLGRLGIEYEKQVSEPEPFRKASGFADPVERQHRQFDQLVGFTQKVMRDADTRRAEFWAKADRSSVAKWEVSCKQYRDYFREEVIGKLPAPTEPMNPSSRRVYDEPKWAGYEVTLDLYPDVFAYGILLLPKDLKPGERRPVVVCQHGLEGRPIDVVNPRMRTPYYNSFGARLADLGYIVYAPQNPYIGRDAFRVLQRRANPLKLSLFSFIIRQHERTLDWLAGLPFVDPDKIAFYGLSYGGKTAMRVPAILPRYCLSICSGDFNEWIWKNASYDFRGSYVFTGEYEMFEFDLGNTFGYAEMANLILPRPFMVERGHDDGVGIDEWVAYEYAKVRRTYDKFGIGDRTTIEFFNGGHECHCEGTFAFLKQHLQWPR